MADSPQSPNSTNSISDILPACFHRGVTQEWSNYDSVQEEMRSIDYAYVEAIHLVPDGNVVAMAKIGMYSLDPKENGATELDPSDPETFNYIGKWQINKGQLTARVNKASDKVSLSDKWVGIFFLPRSFAITEGRFDGEKIHAQVSYDRHSIYGENDPAGVGYSLVSKA